jgi:hypothetical protein
VTPRATCHRDVEGMLADVHALLDAGVQRRTEDGGIEFAYDTVHVDLTLRAA